MEDESGEMDTGGTKLAIAILILWVAMMFYFIALHPMGISGVTNPVGALKWLMMEFQNVSGITAASAETNPAGPQNVSAAPTETGA